MSASPVLHLDVESRSTVELPSRGSYVYWENPVTEVTIACYAANDNDVGVWRRGEPVPDVIRQAANDNWPLFGHNANFERLALRHDLTPRCGWPEFKLENFRCTAAMAAAMALPRSLDGASRALGLDVQKDEEGRRLMLRMCKPRRVLPDGTIIWWDDEERMRRLIAYCKNDVIVERELTKRLRPLIPSEQAIWLLDAQINDRGVAIDVENVQAARALVGDALDELNTELAALTKHKVTEVTQTALLTGWLADRGVDLTVVDKKATKKAVEELQAELSAQAEPEPKELPIVTRLSIDKATLRRAAADESLDKTTKRVIEIRQAGARSSTAKLTSMLDRVCDDGRVRENLLYCAASTGRWGGKGVQLQNLFRPTIPWQAIKGLFEVMRSRELEWLKLFARDKQGKPVELLEAIASCLRSFVVAEAGCELTFGDYSNIEGRVLAWLAGAESKLDAFRAFDAGLGPDLYLLAAAAIYGVPVSTLNSDSPERLVGKVGELALGFQGGLVAFQSMAALYDVIVPDDQADAIKRGWRSAPMNVPITQFWRDLEDAAFAAVLNPEQPYWAGEHIAFLCRKGVLWMQLPAVGDDGEHRRLAYVSPGIKLAMMPWGEEREVVHFMGVNPVTKQWSQQKLYGGLLAENATQATARDVMAAAMRRMAALGWPIVLTIHDEIMVEATIGLISTDDFRAEMVRPEPWMAGLPVTCDIKQGLRFRK